ncbi:MAG: hypothetical protein IKV04_01695 [Alistipes sp.]|nr:hypothetical protein [Alistipes sp.]
MKRTLMLIGLGIAFVGASLWVVLSGGRSAKAIRAKFRLGGAILTIVSFTSLASCEKNVGCYDPAPPPHNTLTTEAGKGAVYSNGDKISIYCDFAFADSVTFTLLSDKEEVLQSETMTLEPGEACVDITLNVGDYRGKATLRASYNVYENEPIEVDFVIIII